MDAPKTLQEAIIYFSDPQRAFDYALKLRFPLGNVACPRCGGSKHSFIKTRRIWFCYDCKKQFSLKVGTIFEDSPLGLDKWMVAFWLLANCKNGISSYELGKAIGVHQNSAWFVLQRVRRVMQDDFFGSKLGGGSGEIEVDESFIGGKARNMHVSKRKRRITGTGTKDKTAVMGILERGGKIRTTVVPNRKKHALQSEVYKHVTAGAALYSDALPSYNGLESDYAHKVVDHAVQYVDGRVHTNGLENFWSLLKRGISGTYVSVEPFHLFSIPR
jgi:transposase-like protein